MEFFLWRHLASLNPIIGRNEKLTKADDRKIPPFGRNDLYRCEKGGMGKSIREVTQKILGTIGR